MRHLLLDVKLGATGVLVDATIYDYHKQGVSTVVAWKRQLSKLTGLFLDRLRSGIVLFV